MKKFLFAMIACFGVVGGAVAGHFAEMKSFATCGKASVTDDECFHVGNRRYVECDDGSGDAPAKTRAYWAGATEVFTRRCYISPDIFGNDYWTSQESVKRCVKDQCSTGSKMKLPGTTSRFICGKANQGIKTIGDSVFVGGGNNDNADCFYYACDINSPVGTRKPADNCGEGVDPLATKCEVVCTKDEHSQEAKWVKFVKECKAGSTPGGHREYGYTNCNGGTQNTGKCPNGSKYFDWFLGEADFRKQCSAKGNEYEFKCYQNKENGGCACGACEKKQEQKKSCRESRAGNLEGMACCDLPKETAKWEEGKCNCSGGLKFEIINGKGMCVQEVKPGEKFECNAVILNALNTWLKDCVENTQIVTLITEIQTLCKSEDRTVEKFNALYQTLLALNPGDCKKEEVTQTNITIDVEVQNENRLARENIIAAHGQLEKIASGFGEASKWKTAEGNFNTARLMTDLSAGVVLGTVGGVVTSVLVKKKQVEEGFEDLKCTIGGQVVGNWGDEFRVGMQQ